MGIIKGLIIDLDNCIFDTKSMGESLIAPVLSAMSMADREKFFDEKKFVEVNEDLWKLSLDDAVKKHGVPKDIFDAMKKAYCNLEAPPWSKNYEDVEFLRKISQRKILVTSGYSKLQWSKIQVTGISNLFDEITIDSIDDPKRRLGKKAIFEDILKSYKWIPTEVMVIGDSAISELKAGKELGMVTIQTLRPNVQMVDGFDHYVEGFKEIAGLLERHPYN